MALSDQLTAGNASDVQVVTPSAPATSGPTHAQSGANGPDPTGLRASLEKNLASAAQKATEQINAAKVKPESKPDVQTSEGRQRGPDGKFLAADASADDAAKPVKAAEAASTPAAQDVDEPPASWRTEAKALWKEIDAKLGPDQGKLLKEELRKRENDFTNGILAKDGELKAIKPVHDELQNLFKPHVARWQSQGITPQMAVSHLLNLQSNFQRDPAGTIRWLAQSARLNLTDLAQPQQNGGQSGGNADPQLQPLLQEINGLKGELHTLRNGFTEQTQAAAAAEIQAFIDEKGQDGQPLRPYFNDAFQKIQMLMPSIKAEHPGWTPRQVVNEAYETAAWGSADIRQKLLDAGKSQDAAAQDAAARQRAAEAAAKSATNGSTPNRLNGAPDPKNLRATLASKMGLQEGRI